MSKQTLAVVIGAVVVFAVALVAALSFTGGGDDGAVHRMPDGRTMTGGEMDSPPSDRTMPGMDMRGSPSR